MNYEVVELNEKNVVGITTRISNKDKSMTQAIGGLWHNFLNHLRHLQEQSFWGIGIVIRTDAYK